MVTFIMISIYFALKIGNKFRWEYCGHLQEGVNYIIYLYMCVRVCILKLNYYKLSEKKKSFVLRNIDFLGPIKLCRTWCTKWSLDFIKVSRVSFFSL